MIDARWQKVIEEYEGVEAFRTPVNVDGISEDSRAHSPEATLSARQKVALALSGASAVVFFLIRLMTA